MPEEVYNVVVWFTNGESRVFPATDYYEDETHLVLKTPDGGVQWINTSSVSSVLNPKRDWKEHWSNTNA